MPASRGNVLFSPGDSTNLAVTCINIVVPFPSEVSNIATPTDGLKAQFHVRQSVAITHHPICRINPLPLSVMEIRQNIALERDLKGHFGRRARA